MLPPAGGVSPKRGRAARALFEQSGPSQIGRTGPQSARPGQSRCSLWRGRAPQVFGRCDERLTNQSPADDLRPPCWPDFSSPCLGPPPLMSGPAPHKSAPSLVFRLPIAAMHPNLPPLWHSSPAGSRLRFFRGAMEKSWYFCPGATPEKALANLTINTAVKCYVMPVEILYDMNF